MSDTYQEELYAKLTNQFYHRFDEFIIRKWCDRPEKEVIEDTDRKKAYKRFYSQIKGENIASQQTVKKWFGLGEKYSIPSRENIFKIALATELSVEEATEYLQCGISQPGFQENDYQEFIVMYCLDNKCGLEKCRRMIECYEEKSQFVGKWEQISCTSWLREQYHIVKEYTPEEFLVWMHKHQKYFKGYSMTVLNCYRQLIEQCLSMLRQDIREGLERALRNEGFFDWFSENYSREEYDAQVIERFVKNKLRLRKQPMSAQNAKEIRNMLAIVYAPQDRISDLILEIYATMPGRKKNNGNFMIYNALGNQIKRVDNKYISELLNIAILKEKQMVLQMEVARETDEKIKKQKQKELRKFKQRIHLLQRSDVLVLVQYIVYQRTLKKIEQGENYKAELVQREFQEYADRILGLCGMRKLDEGYMLDYVLLSCFDNAEMYLFSDVIEEVNLE